MATIELAKRSKSDWWKEDLVEVTYENVTVTIGAGKALIVGKVTSETIKQLKWAGYGVILTESPEKIYYRELTVLCSKINPKGIITLLKNNGYKVAVV